MNKTITQWKLPIFVCVLVSMIMLSLEGHGQEKQVVGRVLAADDSQPIIGVSVVIKGTTTGVTTDANGQFTINASPESVLVFRMLGFEAKEVKVGNNTFLTVSLVPAFEKLKEVVVIGYGTQRRGDATGAVSSIDANTINQSVNGTLQQALQGRAAGVEVIQNSGTPGGGVSVNIRGINTIGNKDIAGLNEPLYVVDGIQIEGRDGNVLATINPSDIENIQVLKDASSSAIYGSRASNGVVIVTTKKGVAGKPRISYETYYGLQELPVRLDVMNLREYAEYSQTRAAMLGFGEREAFRSPQFLGEGTNWQKELFGAAPMYNHNLSISGGSETTKFALSGGYFNQDGIAIGSKFNRFNLRVNVDNQATKWLKVGANMTASRTYQRNTVDQSNLVLLALQQRPDVVARNPDGSWGFPAEDNFGNYTTNVIAEALTKENDRRQTQISGTIFSDLNLFKGLTNRTEFSNNIGFDNGYTFNPALDLGPYLTTASSGSRSTANSNYWQFGNYLTYKNKFAEKHDVSLMAGFEAKESKYESLFGARKNFFTNNVFELPIGDAETDENSSAKNSSAMLSYFSRLQYSFNDKYLLTATLRKDASSKFGENYQWGTFPSFAAAWKISNEQFFKNLGINAITNLKLRAGYGEVGNQGWKNYAYGVSLKNIKTVFGTGVLPENIANPDLRWENSKASNIGLDISLFNNRLELVAEAYNKRTNDLLLDLPLPSYAGTSGVGSITAPLVNLGDLRNRGIEFTLNSTNISKKNFSWSSSLIYSRNRNEVLSLVNENAVITKGRVSQTMVGSPIGVMYGYVVDGMFNTADDFYQKDSQGNFILDGNNKKKLVALPKDIQALETFDKMINPNATWLGDYKFKDINGDGVIDEQDRTVIGNPQPKFQYGFTNTFKFKGFDLAVFLQGVYGNVVYNTLRTRFENPANLQGLLKNVNDYAKLEVIDPSLTIDPEDGQTKPADRISSNVRVVNQGTMIPRMTTSNLNENYRDSNRFIEDGSYLRIRNLAFGYNLPANLLTRTGVKAIRAYVNIQNLYTFSKYSGYDPEVGGSNSLEVGTDYGRYPTPRVYTFGLNVNL